LFSPGNVDYPMTDAGAYALSDSPYGTFDQGGNVSEWNETLFLRSLTHRIRGGTWFDNSGYLHASSWSFGGLAPDEYIGVGFRVASIPEPSTLLLVAMASVSLLLPRRTRNGLP
jgi:formylglycine-generating enzyme